jgi:ATP-dependent DNA helicase RecQ
MPVTRAYETAGYQLGAVRRHFPASSDASDWEALLGQACTFSVEATCSLKQRPEADPILAVAQNIVSRGIPTLPSCDLEEKMASALRLTEFDESRRARQTGKYQHVPTSSFHEEKFQGALRRAYVLVEPRAGEENLQASYESWEDHDSSAERQFHLQVFPDLVGEAGAQLLEPQRQIESLLRQTERDREKLRRTLENAEERVGGSLTDALYEQRVDFVLNVPGGGRSSRNGRVIEIDGPQHEETHQAVLDRKREQACSKRGWDTLRIPTSNLRSGLTGPQREELRSFMEHPWAERAQENIEDPLYETETGRRALQMALSPLGVARVQKTLIRLLRAGALSLEDDSWSIAVIERDVPCARMAIENLRSLLQKLRYLRGETGGVPPADLRVYGTEEFSGCALRDEGTLLLGEETGPFEADVLIDLSMLQREGWTYPSGSYPDEIKAECTVALRSAHGARQGNPIATAPPVTYDVGGEDQPPSLQLLLRDLFRKDSFREGQVDILRRALRRKSAIALLPTGAGKSLTYQLGALLQPGVTLVVDPIKSLMRDQHLGLEEEGITASTYVNSSLSGKERGRRLGKMEEGQYLFVFVSPERLMIPGFRKRLREMASEGVWFTHCVIDEAHCVSEWGHDFRTTYLRLGRNARRLLETGDNEDIPLFALTGTASYDVLEDVRRELSLDSMGEEGTITPDTFRRGELNFRVQPVEANTEVDEDAPPSDRSFLLREQVGEAKREALLETLDNLPSLFGEQGREEFYSPGGEDANGGIVFAPHRTWLFGAKDIERFVRREREYLEDRTGFYHGTTEDMDTSDEERLEEAQDAFKRNDLTVLVATKAFGMGIDKPNVRFTVHFNMPQSIESFYQEAGRAGRDREDAFCLVLHCPEPTVPHDEEEQEVSVDKDLMLSFHRNSFRGEEHEMRMVDDVLTREVQIEEDRTQPEIEMMLGQMSPGERKTAYVRFENDNPARLAEYLKERTAAPWSKGVVDEARDYTHDYEAFVDNLSTEAGGRNWSSKYPGLSGELQQIKRDEDARRLFNRIRDQEDTFRAVHRLAIAGAVEDFRFHYGHDVVEMKLRKRRGKGYIQCLQEYLRRYLSPEDAERVEREVREKEDPTTLRKCLRRLIDFVYSRIKRKRRTAIDNMERALEDGTPEDEPFQWVSPEEDKAQAEATKQFEERVYNFFDSRFLPDMRPHLRESYNTDLLWAYIGETQGAEVELRHLRGACDRLLEDNPDHVPFRLLRSYAEVLLPDGQLERAQEDVRRAWERLRERKGHEEAHGTITRLLRKVKNFDSSAEERLAAAVLPVHTDWLGSFMEEVSTAA